MRQSGRSNHERCSERQHIKRATTKRCGVLLETKINQDEVELIEEIHIATGQCGAQAELWYRVPRKLETDEDGGNRISRNQHDILGDLRIRNALHTPQNGVEKNDQHSDTKACFVVGFQEA